MDETTLAALGSSTDPPPFPEPRVYTAAYCEENVYHLLQTLEAQQPLWRGLAVFVSNPSKSVAVWEQRASRSPEADHLVVWDYHCIAWMFPPETRGAVDVLATEESTTHFRRPSWVYDADSTLPQPCPADEYFAATFGDQNAVKDKYRSWFRIVTAGEYLEHFASDRSHMVRENAAGELEYIAPPPPYPAIRGAAGTNLMSEFVCMRSTRHGTVRRSVSGVFEIAEQLAYSGGRISES